MKKDVLFLDKTLHSDDKIMQLVIKLTNDKLKSNDYLTIIYLHIEIRTEYWEIFLKIPLIYVKFKYYVLIQPNMFKICYDIQLMNQNNKDSILV